MHNFKLFFRQGDIQFGRKQGVDLRVTNTDKPRMVETRLEDFFITTNAQKLYL